MQNTELEMITRSRKKQINAGIFARMSVSPRTSVAPGKLPNVQQSPRHKVTCCKIFFSEHHLLQKTPVMFGRTGSKHFC